MNNQKDKSVTRVTKMRETPKINTSRPKSLYRFSLHNMCKEKGSRRRWIFK